MRRNPFKITIVSRALIITIFLLSHIAPASADVELSSGQTVYVPIYTHIYSGLKGHPFNLAATLSIRNTDPLHPIIIQEVNFYDTDGKLLKKYLSEPLQLSAIASTRYIIREAESGGGSGANFIIKWKSDKKVNPPIIEAIMIGTKLGQGISFVSRGQVIKEETD